jgi:PAP2 superfamily
MNSSNSSRRGLLLCGTSLLGLAACGGGNGGGETTAGAATTQALPTSFGRLKSQELVAELFRCKEALLIWNQAAIDASGLDHKPPAPGETRVYGEQLGPGRASRAMAIVHVAMYDAINSIVGSHQLVSPLPLAPSTADIALAIAYAARDTLAALFPAQTTTFDAILATEQARLSIFSTADRLAGIQAGKAAAEAVYAGRILDGSAHAEPRYGIEFKPNAGPTIWTPDPISKGIRAIGAKWGKVRPFILQSGEQMRLPPPPAAGSSEYKAAYQELLDLGGDGISTPTSRSEDATFAGIFWAYDGTPSLCAPSRLYNQVATQVARQQNSNTVELARLLMLVNVAMSDSAIASWETKYFYQFWRPVTGLRLAADGSGAASKTPLFTPLGAPASNLNGPNFTPPFPSYASGHAVFGGALFQTLRAVYGRDDIAFDFISDEYNGVTKDNTGQVRPLKPRSFKNFTQAEEENGRSRIYLGIHWGFDITEGIKQGRSVADWVVDKLGKPV